MTELTENARWFLAENAKYPVEIGEVLDPKLGGAIYTLSNNKQFTLSAEECGYIGQPKWPWDFERQPEQETAVQRAIPYIQGAIGHCDFVINNHGNDPALREWAQSQADNLTHALTLLQGGEPTPDHISDPRNMVTPQPKEPK